MGPLIQRVAIITDVTDTDVSLFFIGYLDRGRPSGSGIVDTDPLVTSHLTDYTNPHQVTAAQVGALSVTTKGAPNGLAPLGANSLVPDTYLPVSPWKPWPVKVAVQSNINILAPGSVLDGLNMTLDSRVLLVGQSTQSQNGVYLWKGAATAMIRDTDADTGSDIYGGMWIVKEGSSPNTGWVNTNLTVPTLGSTNITFIKLLAVPVQGWTNPMVAAGDIIVGGTDGIAVRLAKGVDAQILTMVAGVPSWQVPVAISGALLNPMSASGDLIVGGTSGVAARLGKGANGQVLTLISGMPGWTAPATGMTNPMTTAWDLLVGGSGGAPASLSKGAPGQVLTMVGGMISWASIPSVLSNPMTTQGDLLAGGPLGAPARLAPGVNGQVLTMISGVPGWTAPVTGFANPMTTNGDLIVGGTNGSGSRLAVGTNGQVLTMVAGLPQWVNTTVLTNPMTTAEDLIKGGTAGTPVRVGPGSNGQVLTMVAGVITWAAPATGLSNPMTSSGDMIYGGTSGIPSRVPGGINGHIMTMVAGLPVWATAPGGMNSPMTALGDLIIGGASGTPARIGVGADGQILTVASRSPAWINPPSSGAASISSVTLADNTVNGIVPGASFSTPTAAVRIDFWATRSTNDIYCGYISLTFDRLTVRMLIHEDQLVGAPGLSFRTEQFAGGYRLLYTTTGTGTPVALKFLVNSGAVISSVATVRSVNATTTLTFADQSLFADTTTAAFSVLLPYTPFAGLTYNIKKACNSANALTLDGNGKLIDGASTIVVTAINRPCYTLQFDGVAWNIM